MNTDRLSELFHLACARSQEVLVDLYEDLHDDDGQPILHEDLDAIKSRVQQAVKEIRTELSLINSAVEEF
jgi:hypothetical protein